MDRRFFAKSAFGAIAGAMTFTSASAKENASQKKHTKVSEEKPPLPLNSDEAEEQIKVIQSKRSYENKAKEFVGKSTSILFFADVHLVKRNLVKIKKFRDKHKKFIDDTIHLGDTVGNIYHGNFDLWDAFPDALNVIGNHDTYIMVNGKRATLPDRDKYDDYFKKYIPNWKVKQPQNAEAEAKCFWYKDYNKHLRVIGLDCMRLDDETQLAWFKKIVERTKKLNYTLVIATHIPPECDTNLECNFTSLDYPIVKNIPVNYREYLKIIDEFISTGGKFAAWICGHEHSDKMMYTKGTKNKQFVIAMECATSWSGWTDAVHIPNTASETCWEIISIESPSNVLKIARFGNNYDHYLRHKGTFCYDFIKHKIISQS